MNNAVWPPDRTSSTHPLRIDELSINGLDGVLGLTLCPGKVVRYGLTGSWNRDLAIDLEAIRNWGAKRFICLIERAEFGLLGVQNLPQEVERAGMLWHHLPIRDTMTPNLPFESQWASVKKEIKGALGNGERVLIHCRGGLGRTGTLAAMILMEFGYGPNEAISCVRKARPGAIENDLQESYVREYGLE